MSAKSKTTIDSDLLSFLGSGGRAGSKPLSDIKDKLQDIADSVPTTRVVTFEVFKAGVNTATGDGKYFFEVPADLNSMNLTGVRAWVGSAGTTGTTDIQIHNLTDASDMLSTKITIDSGETSSATAAAAAVIDTAEDDVATLDMIRIDVDAVASTPATGLYVALEFQNA